MPNHLDTVQEQEYKKQILENIKNGKAFAKFKELVYNQQGDISYLENTNQFPKAKYIIPVYSQVTGTVHALDAGMIGKISCELGAGRMNQEDSIDLTAGIILHKKVGSQVQQGEILAYIHTEKENTIEKATKDITQAYQIY